MDEFNSNVIDYITMATTGRLHKILVIYIQVTESGGMSPVRGIIGGGITQVISIVI